MANEESKNKVEEDYEIVESTETAQLCTTDSKTSFVAH